MSRHLFRTISAVIVGALLIGACSSSEDTSSSSRQRNAALPTPWSLTTGTTDDDTNSAVVVDGAGDVITVGTRGNGGLAAAGHDASRTDAMSVAMTSAAPVMTGSVVISKRDSSGATLWTKEFESTSTTSVASVGVDSKGNIYVAGTIAGNIDFDPGAGTTYLVDPAASVINRAFIAKFAVDGTYKVSVYMVADIAYIQDIAVDAAGNIAATGVHMGSLTVFAADRKLSLTGAAYFQPYVARFDSMLEIDWLKQVGSMSYASSRSIAFDSKGNIVFNVSFDSYVVWDASGALVPTSAPSSGAGVMRLAVHPEAPAIAPGFFSAGMIDTVVMKVDATGNYLWGVQLGGAGFDVPAGLGVDSRGDVYVNGSFGSAAMWGSPDPAGVSPVYNETANSIGYLAKITSTGGLKFLKKVGVSESGSGSFEPGRMAVATDGTLVMTGIYWGKILFNATDSGTVTRSDGNPNAFALSYTSDGTFKWVRTFLGGTVYGYDVALDSLGNSHFAGEFYTNLVIDDAMDVAVGTTKGRADGYLVKLSALGASARAGTGVTKVPADSVGPTVLPTLDDVVSGLTPPEVSDVRIIPDNLPAGTNTTLAQKILTVKVKKTITLKSILASVGVLPPAGSKTAATISAKSKKNCSATSARLKGVKVGTCTLTIKVTPKSGKATKSKVSVVVVK